MKGSRKIRTCNQLDSETLGFQPILPKILPGHCAIDFEVSCDGDMT